MKMEDEEARKGNETLSALFLLFLEFFSLQNLITNHEFVVIHSRTIHRFRFFGKSSYGLHCTVTVVSNSSSCVSISECSIQSRSGQWLGLRPRCRGADNAGNVWTMHGHAVQILRQAGTWG